MPRYLSREWIDAADRALASDPTLAEVAAGVRLVVHQVVTDAPGGEIAYDVEIDDGSIRMTTGAARDADVSFTQTWTTACAVARGELSAQGAFMSGRIQISGDLAALVEHGPALAGVSDVLAALRAQTDYE